MGEKKSALRGGPGLPLGDLYKFLQISFYLLKPPAGAGARTDGEESSPPSGTSPAPADAWSGQYISLSTIITNYYTIHFLLIRSYGIYG